MRRPYVKSPLTNQRRGLVVDNDAYDAFTRRIVAADSRRVAAGDIEGITALAALSGHLDEAITEAVTGLRGFGYSWADIGARLGISRQACQQRWGGEAQ